MVVTDKSLGDLFELFRKPAVKIKEHHDRTVEEREYIRPELEQLEAQRRARMAEERERRNSIRAAKRVEREQSAEEKRRSKFAAIAGVTTSAQQSVTEQDKLEAKQKELEVKDPVAEQKKDSAEFQKDLRDYLNVKYESKGGLSERPAFPTDDTPSEPYRPDEPKYADDSGEVTEGKHLNPVVKHESLINPDNAVQPAPAYSEDIPAAMSAVPAAAAVQETVPEIVQETPAEHIVPAGQPASTEEDDLPFDIVPPAGNIHISERQEKPDTDIVEAIKDFTREQAERAAAAEDNARVLGTVINEDENGQRHISEIVAENEQYTLPPLELLNDVVHERSDADIRSEIEHNAVTLVNTLKSFGVETRFLEAARGPSVTRYELQPAPGVKISKITGLVDDIALNLATAGVRIEAPIPNKAAVGIEVPNKTVETVPFREMVDTKEFRETKSKLGAVLGKSISGDIVIADIAKMPHILIAGTTGSGKSVCVNSIIMSILFRSTPDEVRFLMIDPKAVEFMIYNGIPHLLIPVVTDPKKASGALAWAVTEMLNRYKLFSDNNVRNLEGYNKLAKTTENIQPMPQIVIFIDELADLMMASPGEVEDSI
ncbi:MAG: hypothetical protein IK093_12965, partial [Ruminiclostridium sp.]|nr:hypothetical protein [Ruminiclostridium sp.]